MNRACSPCAVKNSKISKNMKFLNPFKTDAFGHDFVVSECCFVIIVFLFPFCDDEVEKILTQPLDTFLSRRVDF